MNGRLDGRAAPPFDAPPHGPTELAQRVLAEQAEWRAFVSAKLGEGAWLFYMSPMDNDRRVYRVGSSIVKIVRRRTYSPGGGQLLAREAEVLSHLAETGLLAEMPRYEEVGPWQVLWRPYVDGQPLARAFEHASIRSRLRMAYRALRSIVVVNSSGVVHSDVVPNNLVVTEDGLVQLIDFGNARVATGAIASYEEWRGILLSRHGVAVRTAKAFGAAALPGSRRLYRAVKLRRQRPFALSVVPSPEYELLAQAWRRLSRWNTSSGEWLAYASLSIDGILFPGWRPWLLRWDRISESVDFRGKTVIDLGCNSGLLGVFAMLAGAASVDGIESDPSIVDAARLVAAAFGVDSRVHAADLNEFVHGNDFGGRDIVVAMSIMEWVRDKQRLLEYIGTHKECLYEGHDDVGREVERLRGVGFRTFRLLLQGDRARPLIHATK